MADYDEDEKAKFELERKKELRRRQIAEKKYAEEKRELNKKSYTSFGKLILSSEKSAPLVSFTAASKSNKGGAPTNLTNPGPIYKFENKYKYKSVSLIKFIYIFYYLILSHLLGVQEPAKDLL